MAYLNCAYMGPLMHPVVEAGDRGTRAKARPWGITPDDFFAGGERAREQFARIIGADAEGVALVPSASYGLSCAARNIEVAPGDGIVVLAEQFPSNVYAWREVAHGRGASLVTVDRPADDDWSRAALDAIDERTAVVALPHCHWTDGGQLDLVRIGARCREVGRRASAGSHPVRRRLALRRGRGTAGLRGLRGLQVVARPLFARLYLGGAGAP